MNPLRLQIDHIGILGPSVESLVSEFQALGFSIVGPAELTAVDASGERVSLGQSSAHVMFADDYIELTAVESPGANHHLAQFLDSPWGVRLLLLACDDIVRTHARCKRRHLFPAEVQTASRALDYLEGAEARFDWFGLPAGDWPDVLVAYVQHLTKPLVFDPSVTRHANGAQGLARLYYRGSDLPAQYAELGDNGRHTIEIVAPGTEEHVLGFPADRTTPFAGVGIGVTDIAGTSDFLRDSNIDARRAHNGLSVQLRCGVRLVFEQIVSRPGARL